MTGINKFSDKDRRKIRLQNHIARDLGSPKYRQRRTPKKALIRDEYEHWTNSEWLKHLNDEKDN